MNDRIEKEKIIQKIDARLEGVPSKEDIDALVELSEKASQYYPNDEEVFRVVKRVVSIFEREDLYRVLANFKSYSYEKLEIILRYIGREENEIPYWVKRTIYEEKNYLNKNKDEFNRLISSLDSELACMIIRLLEDESDYDFIIDFKYERYKNMKEVK